MFKMSENGASTLKKVVNVLLGILLSGKRTAYHVLWLKLKALIAMPLDLALSQIEKSKFSELKEPQHPVIFIVGIHRTGSTFVSQVLGDFLSFYPLGNFSAVFPRSSYYIHKWRKSSFLKWKKKLGQAYKSYYGISMGKYSIGDCYEAWDQWFGKDHYCFDKAILQNNEDEIKAYFARLEKAYGLPLLTKNNRNYLAVSELKRIFPNSLFIVTERSGSATVKSALKASEDYFNSSYLWGIRSSYEFDKKEFESITHAGVHQFLDLEKNFEKQVSDLSDRELMRIPYESFCEDPKPFLDELVNRLKDDFNLPQELIPSINDFDIPPMKVSNRLETNNEIEELFKEISPEYA